jgi:hypothetical protein
MMWPRPITRPARAPSLSAGLTGIAIAVAVAAATTIITLTPNAAGGAAMSQSEITREEAIRKATAAGRASYPDVDRYEVRVTEDAAFWKIAFTDPRAPERGGASHFSVWVDRKTGATQLFKGR